MSSQQTVTFQEALVLLSPCLSINKKTSLVSFNVDAWSVGESYSQRVSKKHGQSMPEERSRGAP